MSIRSRRRDRIAARVVGLALSAALAGCIDGYPRDDLEIVGPLSGGGATGVVSRLNQMNADSLTATRWRFTLPAPCELKLIAKDEQGATAAIDLELLHSDFLIKGNVGSPVHAVEVEFSGAPALAEQHLFEAERWTDAVEYATNLQALQRLCANPR